MQSAPALMPAINVASFGAEFAAPDLIRDAVIWIFSSSSLPSPVCSANVITGISPAHDTRFWSSNTADGEVVRNLHRECLSEMDPIAV
jgi:hypothetical protein